MLAEDLEKGTVEGRRGAKGCWGGRVKRKRRAVDFCLSTRRPAKEINDGKAFSFYRRVVHQESTKSERARVHLKKAFVMGSCSRRRGRNASNFRERALP